jgi:hypothetical protein
MTTQKPIIKDKYDLKTALEDIIRVLDNKEASLFGPLAEDEQRSINWFTEQLAKRRTESAQALENHLAMLESQVNPLSDRVDAIRAKFKNIADPKSWMNMPTHYELEQFSKLMEVLDRITRHDEEQWDRMVRAIDAYRKPVSSEA